jgi:hypothetical protein
MMFSGRRSLQVFTLASVASLVAAALFDQNILAGFIQETPWLTDLMNLPADGMCKMRIRSV